MANTNYSILVGVEFSKGEVQKQLDNVTKNLAPVEIKIDIDNSIKESIKSVENSMNGLKDKVEEVAGASKNLKDSLLDINVANDIISKTTELVTSLVEQVKILDDSVTEFKKVSDLSGESLDDYVSKLSSMGIEVARTGKLLCLSPHNGMVNQCEE